MMDDQRQHLEALRQAHLRRLRELEVKAATLGVSTPPEVATEMVDIQAKLADIGKQLGPAAVRVLPAPVADFVGRDDEIEQLVQRFSHAAEQNTAACVCSIRGMGGLGKTQLALAAAQRLTTAFPNGQVLIELHGASSRSLSSVQALQTVMRAFDREAKLPDDLRELEGVYRASLLGRRVLIIADDARDLVQVRPLIPPTGCALLITSRQRFTLPRMATIDLGTLGSSVAEQLLLNINPEIGAHAAELAKLCGYLPLALRVSAGVLANDDTLSVERYMGRLADERTKLAYLRDPDDADLDTETTLRLSYDSLDMVAQDGLAQLSIFPSGFDLAAAVSVMQPKGEITVENVLGLLRRRSLLEWDATQQRYALHDLVRAFARAQLKDSAAVQLRHATYYANLAVQASGLYQRGGESTMNGLALFDQERPHIDAGLHWVGQCESSLDRDELLLKYARVMMVMGIVRYDARQMRLPLLQQAIIAAQALGREEMVVALLCALGSAYRNFGETEDGIAQYSRALELAQAAGNQQQIVEIVGNLGSAYRNLGKAREAIPYYEQALSLAQATNNWREEAINLGNLGTAYDFIWEPRRAIPYHEADIRIMQEHHHRRGEATALNNLGMSYQSVGEIDRALNYYEQAVQIMRELGDRRGEGNVLGNLGRVYTARGEPHRAVEVLSKRINLAREIGDRRGESTSLGYLADAYTELGEAQKAIELCEEALKVVDITNDQRRRGRLLGSLGRAYAKLGAIDHATRAYEQHLAIAKEIDDRLGEANSSWALGLLLMEQGELGRALELMEICLEHFRANRHMETESRTALVEQLRQQQKQNYHLPSGGR